MTLNSLFEAVAIFKNGKHLLSTDFNLMRCTRGINIKNDLKA